MKKAVYITVFVCALAGLLCLAAPGVHAAEHDGHCYCGGNGGAEHTCDTSITWTPVNSGNVIHVVDGGHYYLQKDTTASITIKNGETVSLCLNGYTLRAQCPVIVYNGVLNICDCRGDGMIRTTYPQNAKGVVMLISSTATTVGTVNFYGGTVDGGTTNAALFCRGVEVKGGVFSLYGGTLQNGVSDGSVSTDSTPGYGGNVLVRNYEGHVGQFVMYGGTVTGGSASSCGGNVFAEKDAAVSILGGILEKGTADYGGNLYYLGQLAMENATVRQGTARNSRGNLYLACAVQLQTNTITQGISAGAPENLRIVRNGTYLSTDHSSLSEALEKMKNDNHPEQLRLQLLADHEEAYTVADTVTLDLNGCTLSGIRISSCVTAFDSDPAYCGRLCYTLQGGTVLPLESWYRVSRPDGDSFLPADFMRITHISLVPSSAAMGYKAQITGDEAALSQIRSVGFELWLEGYTPRAYTRAFCADENLVTLRLQHILSKDRSQLENSENSEKKVHARPIMILTDGTEVRFAEVSYSLKEALHKADQQYAGYSDTQKQALQQLGATFSAVMTDWDVESIHHAPGGHWQSLKQSNLQTWLDRYNAAGLWQGCFVLEEDLDLGTATINIAQGGSLTLCLNGYTLKGSKQIFACRGDLTLCDCHETGFEGTVSSTYATTAYEYAPVAHIWEGSLTLYGGNLKAGGNMRSAGVVAVGQPVSSSKTADFFMYGGSISGGYARFNGGLLNIWHGSNFQMYGGSLYGGYCESDGGGLVVRDGSTANLCGGEIYGCSAAGNGGGVWVTSNATCYLGQVKLYGNTANNGGNVYVNNAQIRIDGATITAGQAQMGGGVFANSGHVSVTGTTKILDNTAQSVGADLHVYYSTDVCADGLTQGADVRISAARHGRVGSDPAIAQYLHCNTDGFSVMQKGSDMVLWNGALCDSAAPEGFSAGYGAVCVNPRELGVPLAGYGDTNERRSQSVDGDLYVTVTAITDESGQTVLLMAGDFSTMTEAQLDPILEHVSYYTGVPRGHIISATSHTHSGPAFTSADPTIVRYRQLLPDLYAQAAIQAMNDRAPATMYTGSFEVGGGKNGYGLNFTRHYKFLRDGVWEYSCDNFGERSLNDKEQVQHVSDADPTMHLVKFDREGTDILMVNWRAHPTMTGGPTKYVLSSDYVGALRDAVKADTGMDVIFFQGAAGNINAVSRLSWESHGLDFKEYGQALSDQIQAAIGNGCLNQRDAGLWQVDNYQYTAVVDRSDNARYEEAKAFVAEYYETFPGNQAPQQERLDWCKARGWTCVFEASSIVRRYEKAEDTETMPLNTLALGEYLAFYTAPGELWDTVSREVEATGFFETVFCLGYSMESYQYFVYDPDNGGAMTYDSYEGFNRTFVAPATINDMLAYWKTTLEAMSKK